MASLGELAGTNWTNMPSVFPDNRSINGMVDIQSKLKMPMVMHNRQWSSRSDYIKKPPIRMVHFQKSSRAERSTCLFFLVLSSAGGLGSDHVRTRLDVY